MKKIILIITLTILSIGFSACGGGDSSSGGTPITPATEIIPITVTCTTPATLETYMTLQSSDTIVKESVDAVVTIYHDADGIKKVCLESGSAHVVR